MQLRPMDDLDYKIYVLEEFRNVPVSSLRLLWPLTLTLDTRTILIPGWCLLY